MSDRLGPLSYSREPRSPYLEMGPRSRERDYSERTAQQIDEEVMRIVEDVHEKVRNLLRQKRSSLERLAAVLLEKESIEGDELKRFVAEMDSQPQQSEMAFKAIKNQ